MSYKNHYTLEQLKNIKSEFSHDEIIKNLQDDDCHDFLKIFSVIEFDLEDINELDLLFYHLTNHSNPIREAIALKLEEIITKDIILNDFNKNQLIKALNDINPNVCRCMCNILKNNQILAKSIEKNIITEINALFLQVQQYEETTKDYFDKKIKNTKNHTKNKILFSLYWFLEGLSFCISNKNNNEISEILSKTINFSDYTIREKTAKILSEINCPSKELLQKAKNDQNLYVKNCLYGKISHDK